MAEESPYTGFLADESVYVLSDNLSDTRLNSLQTNSLIASPTSSTARDHNRSIWTRSPAATVTIDRPMTSLGQKRRQRGSDSRLSAVGPEGLQTKGLRV